ncbi:nuclear transport factor 2 family protein [Runella slithyformis]|uniref:SnoaL-like domain-containing protein n=1 Tax=Runella slithyformis (strain ATCC 29530 / DSM 19594 / LMG 11500 / NCIMB 11436 / LSU 4) TaxID=761193 RepID=A0A7U3ZP46_RUNSL|nr:nuclear transport factor 2 family protein [Runella slithyformis]AEI50780.1 hypothetical protein Runsl_4455 [Runella slithyformis DSM 19594]
MTSLDIAKQYYDSFNQKNWQGMLALLDPNVRHEPNQADEPRIGIEKFTEFLQSMDESYEETLTDMVFFTSSNDTRVAVEFVVNGIYKKGDEGFPVAHGQSYVLPAAAFLEIRDGKITRVTTYYNLTLWIKLVS